MQIYAPFPMESTFLGYRYMTCAFRPVIPYAEQGDLTKTEDMVW